VPIEPILGLAARLPFQPNRVRDLSARGCSWGTKPGRRSENAGGRRDFAARGQRMRTALLCTRIWNGSPCITGNWQICLSWRSPRRIRRPAPRSEPCRRPIAPLTSRRGRPGLLDQALRPSLEPLGAGGELQGAPQQLFPLVPVPGAASPLQEQPAFAPHHRNVIHHDRAMFLRAGHERRIASTRTHDILGKVRTERV
jgi:hypothetical protein